MARMGMVLSIRAIRAIRGLISRMLARLHSCGCGSAALGQTVAPIDPCQQIVQVACASLLSGSVTNSPGGRHRTLVRSIAREQSRK